MYCIALAPYVSGIMQCQSERVSKCALSMYTVYALVAPHYKPTFSVGQVVQKAGIEEQECTEMHRNTCVAGTSLQCTKQQHPLMSIIFSHCQSACGMYE